MIDLTGKKFGRLTVIERVNNRHGKKRWRCRCGCGNELVVIQDSLGSGRTRSCGCLQREVCSLTGQNNLRDLTGKRFGRLTVIERGENGRRGQRRWRCLCDCGRETIVTGGNLRSGGTKTCGCMEGVLKHGATRGSRSAEYRAWLAMKHRCLNPNLLHFKNYGGRGITVCDRWLHHQDDGVHPFLNFLADMGPRPEGRTGKMPTFSLDRIDNDGNYEPSNCRWATTKEQMTNRRNITDLEAENKRLRIRIEELEANGRA